MWSYKFGKWLHIIQLETKADFDYDPGHGERVFACYLYGTIKLRVEQYVSRPIEVYIWDESNYHHFSVPDSVRQVCEWWIKEPGWGGLRFHEYVQGLIKPPIIMKDRGKTTKDLTPKR